MRTKLIALVIASLFAPGSAWALGDAFNWSGSIEVGGRGVNTDGGTRNGAFGNFPGSTVTPFTGPADEAKAQEYQDVNNGVIGVVDVRGSSKDYYLKFFGENFGRDDQYINALGGGYNVFKAQIYSDRMPHNLSFNALTPLANPGSTLQTGFPGTYPQERNPATWNTFNYGFQRNTTGGTIEANFKSPFFFRADYNEVETTGIRPGSGQLGTGSGNGLIEFGVPVEYKTKNSVFEAGYNAKSWNIKLGYLNSKFNNGIDSMQWTNPFMRSALDQSLLPQDNELQKWSLHASVRDLPLDSAFVLRASWTKLTDSFGVLADGLKPTSTSTTPSNLQPTGVGYLITAPSSSNFDGEHKTTSVQASLTSTPLAGLESRLHYNYCDKANNSTEISYAAGSLPAGRAPCTSGPNLVSTPPQPIPQFCIAALPFGENFAYTRNEAGLDLSYRIAPRQKLVGNYTWLKVDRELEPAPSTTDNKVWIEYRNSVLDTLSGRLKYQYLQQRSDIDHSFTNNSSGQTSKQVPYYFSAYDIGNYNQNMVKLTLDWNPIPLLDIGFGATWRKTDYDPPYYGRTDDKRQIYDFTVAYGNPDNFRVMLIGNWGKTDFHQAYHQGTGPTPGGTQTATDFDWGTKNTQDSRLIALQADWAATEQLALTASASWGNTSGGVDFWSGYYGPTCPATGCLGGFNGGPLVNYVTDNTETQRFMIKGTYKINKNWSATAGYAYENYEYTDGQMAGYQSYYPYYQYIPGTNGALSSNNSWYSGAFANPSYRNNIFFVTGIYRFN